MVVFGEVMEPLGDASMSLEGGFEGLWPDYLLPVCGGKEEAASLRARCCAFFPMIDSPSGTKSQEKPYYGCFCFVVFDHSDRKVIPVIWIITARGCWGQWGRKVLLPARHCITNWLKNCSRDSDRLGPHPGRWIIRMAPSPMWDRKCFHWILPLPCAKHHILATVWLAERYSILVCSPSRSLSSLSLCPFLMCFLNSVELWGADSFYFVNLLA